MIDFAKVSPSNLVSIEYCSLFLNNEPCLVYCTYSLPLCFVHSEFRALLLFTSIVLCSNFERCIYLLTLIDFTYEELILRVVCNLYPEKDVLVSNVKD